MILRMSMKMTRMRTKRWRTESTRIIRQHHQAFILIILTFDLNGIYLFADRAAHASDSAIYLQDTLTNSNQLQSSHERQPQHSICVFLVY